MGTHKKGNLDDSRNQPQNPTSLGFFTFLRMTEERPGIIDGGKSGRRGHRIENAALFTLA